MVATVSLATARLFLSIKSLGARLTLDPEWILNNIELSRVQARANARLGATDAELLIEIDAIDSLPDVSGMFGSGSDSGFSSSGRSGSGLRWRDGGIRSTRVGAMDDDGLAAAAFGDVGGETKLGKEEAWALVEVHRSPRPESLSA
jgi:hypothetical protein